MTIANPPTTTCTLPPCPTRMISLVCVAITVISSTTRNGRSLLPSVVPFATHYSTTQSSSSTLYSHRVGIKPYASPLGPSELVPTSCRSKLVITLLERTKLVICAPWLWQRQKSISFFTAPPTMRLEGDSIAYSKSAVPSQPFLATWTKGALNCISGRL